MAVVVVVDDRGTGLAAVADERVPLAADRGRQACSSTSTRAWWIVGWEPTKCRASSSPNASGESMPYFLANAKTVFFWVSVVSTAALSPVRWTASMSPDSATLTVRSLMWWTSPSLVTRTTWVSALP